MVIPRRSVGASTMGQVRSPGIVHTPLDTVFSHALHKETEENSGLDMLIQCSRDKVSRFHPLQAAGLRLSMITHVFPACIL